MFTPDNFLTNQYSARLSSRFVVISILILIITGIGNVSFAAVNWPQFRGPNGTGVSDTTGLPIEFGPDKSVVWKVTLPPGHSSPVLTNDRIFLTAFDGNQLLTICVDRKTGKLQWRNEAPRSRNNRLLKPNNPASPSPVTDGQNVYVFFQDFGLLSYTADGKERWKLPMGPFNMFYGFGASPILVDDKIVLPCDQDTDSFLIAVDKNTGWVKWKVARPGVISGYSTPIVYRAKNGATQIIIPESFQLSAYNAANGERQWWVRGLACEMKSIPSHDAESLYINGWGLPQNQPGQHVTTLPFAEAVAKYDADKDGSVAQSESAFDKLLKSYFEAFDLDRNSKLDAKEWEVYRAMMAADNGLLAIRLGGKGDMTESSIRWRYQRPVPQVPSTVLYQGVLYMVNDSGILLSFDPATGNVIKQGRLKGAIDKYFASPVAADGKVYLIGQGGTVSVVKAGGEWEILAVNELGEEAYATPAIAEGKLYVRTQGTLYCFGTK